MNCKSVQSRLSAYLDRELGGDELLQIRAHMSTCRGCRDEADGLRALKALFGGIRCPEPPVDLADRLKANMLRQRLGESNRAFRVSAWMFAGVTACSMLATLLILSIGFGRAPAQRMQNSNMAGISAGVSDGSIGGDGLGKVPTLSAANFGPR